MNEHEDLVFQLQALLDQVATQKTKDWWETYLRHVIRFRGVGIPDIRKQLAQWREAYGITMWDKEAQLQLALRLFESRMAEDKLAGILFLQDYLYDQFAWEALIAQYEQLYVRNLIFDWSTCDWFCVRVLGPTIAKHGPPCAEAIVAWKQAANLWQARSSVVAFVPVASDTRYHPLVLAACEVLIQRDERFAKTAVGWILREFSKYDHVRIRSFVDEHLTCFSIESLKNATKYFSGDEQRTYVQRLKRA